MTISFVRFRRFVRSPLTIAILSLSALWGCRHLPRPQSWVERHQVDLSSTTASDLPEPRPATAYEEPAGSLTPPANVEEFNSLPEGDAFLPVPSAAAPATNPNAETQPRPERSAATRSTPTPEPESPAAGVERSLDVTDAPLPRSERPRPGTITPEPVAVPPKATLSPAVPNVATPPIEPQSPASSPTLEVPPEPAAPDDSSTAANTVRTDESEINSRAPGTSTPDDRTILSLDSYCDGLVFDAQGFGYVSHKRQIIRFSPTGETSIWAILGSPKGHRIEPEGTHLVCDVERRAVLRLSFGGKVIGMAATECDGVPLRAPYDVAVDPRGGFYFTDPGYVQTQNPVGKLHYVDLTGKVSVVAASIGYPTGIAFDPVRQRVFVAESQFNRILEFRLVAPGQVESHNVFVQLPKSPDSEYDLANLCADADGNLYVTQSHSRSVHVFDRQGRPAGRFATGDVVPNSVALWPEAVGTLFVAGELDAHSRRQGTVIRLDLGR